MNTPNEINRGRLPQGTPVQVRDRFEFTFRSGFEVSATTDIGYRLRRRSDGVELPVVFADNDVRPEGRRANWQ